MKLLRNLNGFLPSKMIYRVRYPRVQHTINGLTFVTYKRDARNMLHEQVLLTPKSRIITEPSDTESVVISQPVNGKIRRLGHRAADFLEMNSEHQEVKWTKTREYGEKPTVGSFQRFKNKSCGALGASAYISYPLLLTLLTQNICGGTM